MDSTSIGADPGDRRGRGTYTADGAGYRNVVQGAGEWRRCYLLLTYNAPDEVPWRPPKVMILGGAEPDRAGHRIRLTCVHVAFALRDMGYGRSW
jgi:hypothetical protein